MLPLLALAALGFAGFWMLGWLGSATTLMTAAAIGFIVVGGVKFVQQGTQPMAFILMGVGFSVLFLGDFVDSLTIGEAASMVGDAAASFVGGG